MSEDNPYAPDKSQKKKVLEDLKNVAESVGPKISRDEYDKHGDYSSHTVAQYFGTYSDGLREADLFPTYTNKDDIIRAINKLGEELGRLPTPSDMDKNGIYSQPLVSNHFSDYKTALIEAGYNKTEIKKHYHNEVSTDELISEIQSISEKLGHPPNTAEIKRESEYSYTTYTRRFGADIIKILKEAGFDEQEIEKSSVEKANRNRISDSELIDDIKRISAKTSHRIALLLGFNGVHTVSNTDYGKVTVSVRCNAVYSLS